MDQVGTYNGAMVRETTVSERLENEKKSLEMRLAQINEALEALNKNPEIKDVIDKISQITHFR